MKKISKALLVILGVFVLAFITVDFKDGVQASGDLAGYSFEAVYLSEAEVSQDTILDYSYEKSYGASVWDSCSNSYYYDKLNSKQKDLYDNIYSLCLHYLTSEEDGIYTSGNYYTKAVSIPSGLSDEEIKVVGRLIFTNCPQFYFVNNGILYNSKYVYMKMYSDYVNGHNRVTSTNTFYNLTNQAVAYAKQASNVVDMVKRIHDYVANRTSYAYGAHNQSCAGVFFDGQAVCAGYSEAFQLICNRVGIECISVLSANHQWNKVKINGAWFNVDVTNSSGLRYYLVPDSSLKAGLHTPVEDWNSALGLPSCTRTTVPSQEIGDTVYDGVDYSAVYDYQFYKSRYRDLANAFGVNQKAYLEHFVKYGMEEGRQASASFDVSSYRKKYRDLRTAFGNNTKAYYMHYIKYGCYEGRQATGCTTLNGAVTVYGGVDYSAVYDYNYYTSTYKDIANAFGEDDIAVLKHFVNYGMKEGRQGCASFSVKSYRNQYTDLRNVYGSDLTSYYLHYMKWGRSEGRAGTGCTSLQGGITVYDGVNYSRVYNYNYYIANNRDILKAFGGDEYLTLKHFVEYGMEEGRKSSAGFNVTTYMNNYRDLRNAYGNDYSSYFMHYIKYGYSEGRTAA